MASSCGGVFVAVASLLVVAITLSMALPIERSVQTSYTQSGSSMSLVPLTAAVSNVANSTDDTASNGIILRRILLGAFLPGGLGEAINNQRKEPKQHENLVDTVQDIKEELVGIRKILREQQDDENYRQYLAKVERDKDSFDFFDAVEFIILACVFYILLKVVIWMCDHTTKAVKDAKAMQQQQQAKADEEALLVTACPTYQMQQGQDKPLADPIV